MGLDCSHGAWSQPYGVFSRWREALAQAAGYAVWPVVVDEQGHSRLHVMLDWGHVTESMMMGKWFETPADPLMIILVHHDNQGVIQYEEAIDLADRLEELLPLLPEEDPYDLRDLTRQFVSGLHLASHRSQDLEFQ